jgi:hypothetical protein
VANLVLWDDVRLDAEVRNRLLGGVTVVWGDAAVVLRSAPDGSFVKRPGRITLIPYYAWAHRGPGEMMVWLAREDAKALPPAPAAPPSGAPKADGGAS